MGKGENVGMNTLRNTGERTSEKHGLVHLLPQVY